ncbi:MAG: glycosyltransferase [Patescibacteria group bacterium]|nr:glycosyltransferase [Patescibacteria group bacterium]MDE2438438.1 glycosyltransferase [Patescibacteria group bacterium]
MNILQIGTIDNAGGAARVSWNLKTSLEKKGHTTSMFVAWKYSKDENVFSIPRYPQQERISKIFANDIDLYATDYILETDAFLNADIVHCHNLHGYYFNLGTLVKMAKKKPVVWTLHDMWAITPHCAHAFDGALRDGFFTCPSIDIYPQIYWNNAGYLKKRKASLYRTLGVHLAVPSRWLKEKVSKSILHDKPASLIYNGIDTDIFVRKEKSDARKELELPARKKIILFLASGGKNDPKKGWRYAEEAMRYYEHDPDILFLCIGGSEEDRAGSNEHIRFIPRVDHDEMLASYYSASDVFLFTSVAENFPLVVLEAMSCGLPIVSFDVGGVKEAVLHKENGFIAPYQKIEDLMEGIHYVLGLSTHERETMAAASFKRVRNYFTLDRMVDEYLALYSSLL